MSLGVNVKNSSPNTGKPIRVFLSDVELAKKNEWNRRRKLRLLQVRQQAKDLAYSLRNKVKSERELTSKKYEKKCNDELNNWKKCQLDRLHLEYEGCLSEIGTGHLNAQQKPDEDPKLKEQYELMAALSRARGAVALKKAREERIANIEKKEAAVKCKELARNLENVRAQLISSLPKPQNIQQPPKKVISVKIPSPSKKRKKSVISRVLSERPVNITLQKNFIEAAAQTIGDEKSPKKVISVPKHQQSTNVHKSPSKKLCFATTADVHSFSRNDATENDDTLVDKQCSPPRHRRHNLSECDYMSESDSADSDVTWPPRSSGVNKHLSRQKVVKLYDHDSRTCSKYPRPSSIIPISESNCNQLILSPETMKEECGRVFKANLEGNALRAEWRKKQALRGKDNLRKEFCEMLQELTNLNKEERMRRVHCGSGLLSSKKYDGRNENCTKPTQSRGVSQGHQMPQHVHHGDDKQIEELEISCNPFEAQHSVNRDTIHTENHKSKKSNSSIQQLIEKIQRKREELLNTQFDYLGRDQRDDSNLHGTEADCYNEVEIPSWILQPLESDDLAECNDTSFKSKKFEEVVHTKKPCPVKESIVDEKDNSPQEFTNLKCADETTENKKSPIKASILHEEEKIEAPESCDEILPLSSLVQNDSEQSLGSSTSQTSTSSFQGIKLVIEVSEKKRKSLKRKSRKSEFEEAIVGNSKNVQEGTTLPLWPGIINGGAENSGTTSTTYLSPPQYLSPVQQGLLNSILNKVEVKNHNPQLKQWILKLLTMSRDSVENLSETVSDVSLSSDVINAMNNAQSERKVYAETNGYGLRCTTCSEHRKLKHGISDLGKVERSECLCSQNKQEGIKDSLFFQQGLNTIENREVQSFSDLADRYSQRISALAQMIDNLNLTPGPTNGSDINNTSYLSIPAECNESVKISDSIDYVAKSEVYPRPELSFDNTADANHLNKYLSDYSKNKQSNLDWFLAKPQLREEDIAALGLTTELLPKPFVSEENMHMPVQAKHKPPSSLQKHRGYIPSAVPHELSAIPEAETPSTSHYHHSSDRPGENQTLRSDSPKFNLEESFSCLDYEDLELSSIASCSPKKSSERGFKLNSKGNIEQRHNFSNCRQSDDFGSSVSILSNLSNCSLKDGKGLLSESSSENMEEVFRSLGISWAWTTLRKIKEAQQLSSSSVSPEVNGARDKVSRSNERTTNNSKGGFVKYKHSTPVKRQEKVSLCTDIPKSSNNGSSFGSSELSSVNGSSNRTDGLTPPNLSLQAPSLIGLQKTIKHH